MTMFRRLSGGYGGGCVEGFGVMSQLEGYYCHHSYDFYNSSCSSEPCLGSDLEILGVGPVSLMTEDEAARTAESLKEGGNSRSGGGAESSSKEARDDEGWLQLSIGSRSRDEEKQDPETKDGPGLIELELLPSNNNNNINNNNNSIQMMRPLGPPIQAPRQLMSFPTGFNPSFYFPQYHPGTVSSSSNFPQHQEINWGFRPVVVPNNTPRAAVAGSSCSSSSTFFVGSGSYFSRPPFQLFAGVDTAPGPSLDFRVIPPPRRPHSGIWFMLQASQNQEREPFLPQISKSYLRIKDGRMTIRLVIKYLINKLRLVDESEIEITCKGQRLQPFLTVQHVRDNIWNPRDNNFITLLPNSSTTQHIMVLQYGRAASN